jgi:hypothetical protein
MLEVLRTKNTNAAEILSCWRCYKASDGMDDVFETQEKRQKKMPLFDRLESRIDEK